MGSGQFALGYSTRTSTRTRTGAAHDRTRLRDVLLCDSTTVRIG